MIAQRTFEAAIARIKGGVASLLKPLIVFYLIALGVACSVGISLFLIWIFRILLSMRT